MAVLVCRGYSAEMNNSFFPVLNVQTHQNIYLWCYGFVELLLLIKLLWWHGPQSEISLMFVLKYLSYLHYKKTNLLLTDRHLMIFVERMLQFFVLAQECS